MDSLDIQVVDSLTVNLNQEDYSTEGQIQNDIAVYVEDEQQLFDAALTQDSINLYTRETPDIINIKEITDGISRVENEIKNTSKEATLLAKVAELKEALNTIDFTAIEQAIQNIENVNAREATLIQGVGDIIKAVENIDFTDLENSIAEVKNAVINIDLSALAKENTLTQGIASISQKIDNIDLSSVENKVDEGVETLSSKIDNIDLSAVEAKVETESQTIQSAIQNIDLSSVENKVDEVKQAVENIKLPEIDTSAIAKQGENQDATNTAIYALLSQFGESVLQEKVTVILNCQENIVWQDYAVNVTFEDGRTQAVPLSESGTCSFSIKIGQNYSVQLPVIGTFIAPELKTYTAISSAREIYWSYVAMGIFGIDELGRRYTIEQIEALADKSIIKYGGYTDEELENVLRADGTYGCGFMWDLRQEDITVAWASKKVEFSQELLPFITSKEEALKYCDGKAYTQYIISEGARLSVNTPSASECVKRSIVVNNNKINGYLGGYGQLVKLPINRTTFNLLYTTLSLSIPPYFNNYLQTSCQASVESQVNLRQGGFNINTLYADKTVAGYIYTLVIYDLPK